MSTNYQKWTFVKLAGAAPDNAFIFVKIPLG